MLLLLASLKKEGAGKAGYRLAPAIRAQEMRTGWTAGQPISPAFPARMVFGLYAICLARRSSIAAITLRIADTSKAPVGLVAPPQGLTPAFGRQHHAISPTADVHAQAFEGWRALTLETQARTLFSAVRPARRKITHGPRLKADHRPAIPFARNAAASTASQPAYPDDRDTPFVSGGTNRVYDKSEFRKIKIFLPQELDGFFGGVFCRAGRAVVPRACDKDELVIVGTQTYKIPFGALTRI